MDLDVVGCVVSSLSLESDITTSMNVCGFASFKLFMVIHLDGTNYSIYLLLESIDDSYGPLGSKHFLANFFQRLFHFFFSTLNPNK